MSGDRYVYRIKVTNNGIDTATGISVTDTIPAALTAFQIENNGFTSYGLLPNYFSGYVASLAE
jgi:uncharacterized repeat protein (TIGR01451 family)